MGQRHTSAGKDDSKVIRPNVDHPRRFAVMRVWLRPDQVAWLDRQVMLRKGLAIHTGEKRINFNRGTILRELVDQKIEEEDQSVHPNENRST